MASIKETTDVVNFGIAVVKAVQAAKADGKIDLGDLAQLFPLIPAASAAFENIGLVPAELKDLDPAEATELISSVMAGLSINDPKARLVVDSSLKFAIAGYGLYQAVKA